jgi:WD40 repeat protein
MTPAGKTFFGIPDPERFHSRLTAVAANAACDLPFDPNTVFAVTSVAFSPDGKILAIAGEDHTTKLLDIENARVLRAFVGGQDKVVSVAFSPDGKMLASASYDGNLKLWNTETGEEVHALQRDHSASILSGQLEFSPDGKTLVSALDGPDYGPVIVWDVVTAEAAYTVTRPGDRIGFVFLANGEMLVWSTAGNELTFVDVSTKQTVSLIDMHWGRDDVGTITIGIPIGFSPDGGMFATHKSITYWQNVSDDTHGDWVTIYGTSSGREASSLGDGHNFPCRAAFSPDGETLASIGCSFQDMDGKILRMGSIKLWNLRTGRELHTLRGHTNVPTVAVFSPDGRTLASGSMDGTVKLWDVETGEELATFSNTLYLP